MEKKKSKRLWGAEGGKEGGKGGKKRRRKKASLGNYWTRLGSWGNSSGTRGPNCWGCGRQDHMEGGLWLCSLKLVTRLLPSPWAECEMRLARPNVLHMHHLCHKTNLITVNYGAAIIRRGPHHSLSHTHNVMHTQIRANTSVERQHLWKVGCRSEAFKVQTHPPRPGQVHFCIQVDGPSKRMCVSVHICMNMCVCVLTDEELYRRKAHSE